MASRVYVQEGIADKFIDLLKKNFETASSNGSIGNPEDKNTKVGPIADQAQFKRVMEFLEVGKKDGELVTGGCRRGNDGLFVEPTVFKNTPSDSKIVREEVFGPVVTVQTFKTEEEAIELANDSIFGLSGMSLPLDELEIRRVILIITQPASTPEISAERSVSARRLRQEPLRLMTGTSLLLAHLSVASSNLVMVERVVRTDSTNIYKPRRFRSSKSTPHPCPCPRENCANRFQL